MESMTPITPIYFYETPKHKDRFVFPPGSSLASSVDRLISTYPRNSRSSRNFTPCKSSLTIQTPDISPIEFDFSKFKQEMVYLTPENVCKASADSTVNTSGDSFCENAMPLMPPPVRRPFRASSIRRASSSCAKEAGISPSSVQLWKGNSEASDLQIPMGSQMASLQGESSFLNEQISVLGTLSYIGLSKHVEIFQKAEIDFNTFLNLTNDNLIAMGVSDGADREIILNFIKELSFSKLF